MSTHTHTNKILEQDKSTFWLWKIWGMQMNPVCTIIPCPFDYEESPGGAMKGTEASSSVTWNLCSAHTLSSMTSAVLAG